MGNNLTTNPSRVSLATSWEASTATPQLWKHNGDLANAIMHTLEEGKLRKVERVVEKYGVDAQNKNGSTLLVWAARFNWAASARHLIKRGADPNLPNIYGWTPLHFACRNSVSKELIRLLLEAGADKDIKNKDGQPPRYLCPTAASRAVFDSAVRAFEADSNISKVRQEQEKEPVAATRMPQLLVWPERKLEFSLQNTTIRIGHNARNDIQIRHPRVSEQHAIIEDGKLMDRSTNGTFINGKKVRKGVPQTLRAGDEIKFGYSVMMVEAERPTAESSKKAKKGVPQLWDDDSALSLALYSILEEGKVSEVERVIKVYGVDAQNKKGWTLLSYCAFMDWVASARHLVKRGADLNHKNKRGQTPLHQACLGNASKEMVRMLLDAGADKDIKNKDGKIPHDCCGDDAMAKFDDVVRTYEKQQYPGRFCVFKGCLVYAGDATVPCFVCKRAFCSTHICEDGRCADCSEERAEQRKRDRLLEEQFKHLAMQPNPSQQQREQERKELEERLRSLEQQLVEVAARGSGQDQLVEIADMIKETQKKIGDNHEEVVDGVDDLRGRVRGLQDTE